MRTRVLITTALIAVMACKDESPTSPSPDTPLVEALSPISMEGVVGATAATVPAVRLTDKRTGAPLSNIPVYFIPQDGGSVTTGHTTTDADGIARAGEWTFGPRTGTSELWVEAFGTHWFSFRATLKPDVPSRLFTYDTVDRVRLVGDVSDVWLIVQDAFLNLIPNIELKVSIVAASGSVIESTQVSDDHGYAVVRWTLDSMPGINSLTVTVPGVEPFVLKARGVDPATVKWYDLESLSLSDGKTYGPDFYRISESRIGFTSFDGCVCLRPDGYYIRMIKFSDSSRVSSWSGTYTFSGNQLSTNNGDWSSAKLEGDVLLLSSLDPWDNEYPVTWIYRVAK